ncbi:hypothetical protein ACS0TY_019528 [Phlomoides rotata]
MNGRGRDAPPASGGEFLLHLLRNPPSSGPPSSPQPPPSQSFSQDPAVAAVGPSIPTFRMPFPPNGQNLPYPQWNHFPSPPFATNNYIQQNPSANPNLNPDFSSPPPGVFNYTSPQFDLHFKRDDTRNLAVNLKPPPNLIFGSLNRDILPNGGADALNQGLLRNIEEGLGMDRRLNRFPLNSVEVNENAQGNSSVLRGYKQERSSNSNGNSKVVAPPPGFSSNTKNQRNREYGYGHGQKSDRLSNPRLPAGSNVPSSSASDIEESMVDELRSGRNLILEVPLVDSLRLKDESGEKSDKKKHHRDKDYRSDKRGQWIMGQRMRHLKRQAACRNDIRTFNGPLLAVFESLIPSDEEKIKQRQLLMLLEKLVGKEWPEARLYLYGSCANSFGFSKSDIDVCLEMDLGNIDKPKVLLKLAEVFESDNLQNVQALTRARVPVVKLMDPATGISCDICINNVLAVINTKLLHDYSKIDARLRQLAFIVKHWAKSRGVNETYHGTLSSYAYVLMCIHFLQQRRPPILPCLQGMPTTYYATVDHIECGYFDEVEKLQNFGAQNGESIAQLVWAFFHYWAYCHDYADDVISVRTGRTLSKRDKDWTRRVGNDRHLICIEDPFETSHDLGRVVDKNSIRVLREEFERAAQIMQHDPNPCLTLFAPYVPN